MSRLRSKLRDAAPTATIEKQLWEQGKSVVVGLDEVGRGAWAGPVSVGAVVIPKNRRIYKVRDSKMLTATEREALYQPIIDWCETSAVGHVSASECDRLGMSQALRLAARRAIEQLQVEPDKILLDGNFDFVGMGNTILVTKGDATCLSIATASVLAKVTRDRMMQQDDEMFPAYDFASNKGYPSPRHKWALNGYGPSSIHRVSWSFMDDLAWSNSYATAVKPKQLSLFEP